MFSAKCLVLGLIICAVHSLTISDTTLAPIYGKLDSRNLEQMSEVASNLKSKLFKLWSSSSDSKNTYKSDIPVDFSHIKASFREKRASPTEELMANKGAGEATKGMTFLQKLEMVRNLQYNISIPVTTPRPAWRRFTRRPFIVRTTEAPTEMVQTLNRYQPPQEEKPEIPPVLNSGPARTEHQQLTDSKIPGGPTEAEYINPSSPSETGAVEVGLSETGPADAGHFQVGPSEAGPIQVGLSEAGLSEAGPPEVGFSEAVPAELGPAEAGPVEDPLLNNPYIPDHYAAQPTGENPAMDNQMIPAARTETEQGSETPANSYQPSPKQQPYIPDTSQQRFYPNRNRQLMNVPAEQPENSNLPANSVNPERSGPFQNLPTNQQPMAYPPNPQEQAYPSNPNQQEPGENQAPRPVPYQNPNQALQPPLGSNPGPGSMPYPRQDPYQNQQPPPGNQAPGQVPYQNQQPPPGNQAPGQVPYQNQQPPPGNQAPGQVPYQNQQPPPGNQAPGQVPYQNPSQAYQPPPGSNPGPVSVPYPPPPTHDSYPINNPDPYPVDPQHPSASTNQGVRPPPMNSGQPPMTHQQLPVAANPNQQPVYHQNHQGPIPVNQQRPAKQYPTNTNNGQPQFSQNTGLQPTQKQAPVPYSQNTQHQGPYRQQPGPIPQNQRPYQQNPAPVPQKPVPYQPRQQPYPQIPGSVPATNQQRPYPQTQNQNGPYSNTQHQGPVPHHQPGQTHQAQYPVQQHNPSPGLILNNHQNQSQGLLTHVPIGHHPSGNVNPALNQTYPQYPQGYPQQQPYPSQVPPAWQRQYPNRQNGFTASGQPLPTNPSPTGYHTGSTGGTTYNDKGLPPTGTYPYYYTDGSQNPQTTKPPPVATALMTESQREAIEDAAEDRREALALLNANGHNLTALPPNYSIPPEADEIEYEDGMTPPSITPPKPTPQTQSPYWYEGPPYNGMHYYPQPQPGIYPDKSLAQDVGIYPLSTPPPVNQPYHNHMTPYPVNKQPAYPYPQPNQQANQGQQYKQPLPSQQPPNKNQYHQQPPNRNQNQKPPYNGYPNRQPVNQPTRQPVRQPVQQPPNRPPVNRQTPFNRQQTGNRQTPVNQQQPVNRQQPVNQQQPVYRKPPVNRQQQPVRTNQNPQYARPPPQNSRPTNQNRQNIPQTNQNPAAQPRTQPRVNQQNPQQPQPSPNQNVKTPGQNRGQTAFLNQKTKETTTTAKVSNAPEVVATADTGPTSNEIAGIVVGTILGMIVILGPLMCLAVKYKTFLKQKRKRFFPRPFSQRTETHGSRDAMDSMVFSELGQETLPFDSDGHQSATEHDHLMSRRGQAPRTSSRLATISGNEESNLYNNNFENTNQSEAPTQPMSLTSSKRSDSLEISRLMTLREGKEEEIYSDPPEEPMAPVLPPRGKTRGKGFPHHFTGSVQMLHK